MDSLNTSSWSSCIDSATGVPQLTCLWVILSNILNAFLTLSGLVALLLIIYSGIKFIMSRGDKEKIEGARKTFIFAIIGLVFILLSFYILVFIGQLTGIKIDKLITPPS